MNRVEPSGISLALLRMLDHERSFSFSATLTKGSGVRRKAAISCFHSRPLR
jgi:hypothetical protein